MVVGTALACAPAAVPAPSAPAAPAAGAAAWEQEWNELVAAANKEGKLALVTTTGTGIRENVARFQEAFPGITVEHSSLVASQFIPRVMPELQAGVYNYDLLTSSFSQRTLELVKGNHLLPLKPALIRPDVTADDRWARGFSDGWRDSARQYVYAGYQVLNRLLWVNSDLINEGEIRSVQDLLDPKWKGKILSADPRRQGYGISFATAVRTGLKDDGIIKRLWKDQEVTLHVDERLLAEWMVQGRYPIGIGTMHPPVVAEYLALGLGKNIKALSLEHTEIAGGGFSSIFVFAKAQHPNAAKLFANWMLTKEGATIWSAGAQENSRRTDVPPGQPDLMPDPRRTYFRTDTEDGIALSAESIKLAQAALN